MKREIELLREKMKENKLDAYYVPTADWHGSEYINNFFKQRQFLTGFTGSAGDLIVTFNEACLWVDGRYFLQAAKQLEGSGIILMKSGEEGVPTIEEYLKEKLSSEDTLGFDGRMVNVELCDSIGCEISVDKDLVDEIWKDRPGLNPKPIYSLPIESTGMYRKDKIKLVRKAIAETGAGCHVATCLEDIAWLLNLRGDDIANTPVFYSYAMICQERVRLYAFKECINEEILKELEADGVEVYDYEQIYEDASSLDAIVLIDKNKVNYKLYQSITGEGIIKNQRNPLETLKCIKNPIEIKATLNAHRKDGIAMVKFLKWLKENVGAEKITELDVADKLLELRSSQEGYISLSFDTIAGYQENGAIVHYTATEDDFSVIKPEGLLLVDSGAHYIDGTTDITRTIVCGPLTEDMKLCYTYVLKAMINLAKVKFKMGASGRQIDMVARAELWRNGLDYNHGTGHGVGHVLSVHEDPNGIGPRYPHEPIAPGMITSDEPGIYLENRFGIRLENEILCKEYLETDFGKFFQFETITYCPFERDAIVKELLDPEQLEFMNSYHERVYNELKNDLNEEEKKWLFDATRPL